MGPAVECCECKLRVSISPERYLTVVARRPDSVRELMEKTFPRLPLESANRVVWEKRAIANQLLPPDRLEALREPFVLVSYLALRNSPIISFIALSAALWIGMLVAILAIASSIIPNKQADSILPFVTLGALVLSLGFSAWFLRTTRKRHVQNRLFPMLSRSLRPLRPSSDEIEEVLVWARAMRQPIAHGFTAAHLHEVMTKQPDRSLLHVDEMDTLAMARRLYEELNPGEDAPSPSDSTAEPDENSDSTS